MKATVTRGDGGVDTFGAVSSLKFDAETGWLEVWYGLGDGSMKHQEYAVGQWRGVTFDATAPADYSATVAP